MLSALPAPHRDFLWLHATFAVVCVAVLALPASWPVGWRLLALTAAYNLVVPVLGWARGYRLWLRLWGFAIAFGIFNVLPDTFLTAAGLLVFPPDGAPRLLNLTAYMPLLWAIPVFSLLYLALWAPTLSSVRITGAGFARLLLASAVVFWASEHAFKLIGSWHAAEGLRHTWGNAAVYVLLAEMILMSVAYPMVARVLETPLWLRTARAGLLMATYLLALVAMYMLLEAR